MVEVKSYKKDGSEGKKFALDGDLFNSEPKADILHSYVKGFLKNQRQGNSSTLNRSRMQGGGKKPFRQKGTGRARAGSNTSPLWKGGAIAWGPTPRDYYSRMPKSMKRAAVKSAFSSKAKDGDIRIVELPELPQAKTKIVANFLKGIGISQGKSLLLYDGKNDSLTIASRNIKNFAVKSAQLVNAFDLLLYKNILITESGVSKLKEMYGSD